MRCVNVLPSRLFFLAIASLYPLHRDPVSIGTHDAVSDSQDGNGRSYIVRILRDCQLHKGLCGRYRVQLFPPVRMRLLVSRDKVAAGSYDYHHRIDRAFLKLAGLGPNSLFGEFEPANFNGQMSRARAS